MQLPVPAHPPPLQLVKPDPAVNVIDVPLLNGALQLVVQLLIPVGLELTVPVPTILTVTVGRLKLPVMLVLAVRVKLQDPVEPLQTAAVPVPPLHPVKFEFPSGVAVNNMADPTA